MSPPLRRIWLRVPRISPETYRGITLLAAIALGFIIVTGGAVRLTGSGLGCPDWPTCARHHVVAPVEYHAMVEFVNRVVTGAVSVLVVVAVLGALVREPRRRDLTWLAGGLVAGVVGQIVLGGLAVLEKLAPPFVMAHFLLSLALLCDAVVLHYRAGETVGPARLLVDRWHLALSRALVVLTTVAVFLGTVVTSTGPHGGDPKAPRFHFSLHRVAQLHGGAVTALLALTLYLAWSLRRAGAPAAVQARLRALVQIMVLQAGVGYLQYFTGVPVFLVGIHVAGAASVWAGVVWFHAGLASRSPSGAPATVTVSVQPALAGT
ncbi:MAG TPA: COX15/CtaA family protein [Acidimicrobiales bacterium]